MATSSKTTRPTLTTKGTVKKEAEATPAAKKTTAPKPVAGITKPTDDSTQNSTQKPALRKKELLERVLAKVTVKKKDAKPVVEAMLEVLGEAIENGDDLNLQPMGKLINKRLIDKPNAKIMICRLRRRKELAAPAVVNVLK